MHSEQTCDMHRQLMQEDGEFRRLRLATFPIFLAAALLRRLVPQRRRVHATISVIHEARAMADTALGFAYMG